MVAHLPNLLEILSNLLSDAATTLDLPIGSLHLHLVNHAGRIGLAVSGKQDFSAGDFQITLFFGAPAEWGGPATEGVTLLLVDLSGGSVSLNLGSTAGLGLGIEGASGDPLVNYSNVRIGASRLYFFIETADLSVSFGGSAQVASFGFAGSERSGGRERSNPVSTFALRRRSGDSHPEIGRRSRFLVLGLPRHATPPFSSAEHQSGVLWIEFMPIRPDLHRSSRGGMSSTEAGLSLTAESRLGLTAQVDELGDRCSVRPISDPTQWNPDLKGRAMATAGRDRDRRGW